MNRTEAIEVIRKCWPVNRNGMLSDALETLIPELKESEDERIRKALLRCCDDWEKGQYGCMNAADIPSIRAYLEKQREQKPAEWSEEDKKILNAIIGVLEEIKSQPLKRMEDWDGYIRFLKSLRPLPHWKPSEGQMEALKEAMCELDGGVYSDGIDSLYNDLMKL